MAESLLMGRNFVSGICKLKPKKPFRSLKTTYFFKETQILPALGKTSNNLPLPVSIWHSSVMAPKSISLLLMNGRYPDDRDTNAPVTAGLPSQSPRQRNHTRCATRRRRRVFNRIITLSVWNPSNRHRIITVIIIFILIRPSLTSAALIAWQHQRQKQKQRQQMTH